MIRAVIVGCAHMHVNEIAQYIKDQPQTQLCGVADLHPDIPEQTDKRYTRAWNLQNVARLCSERPFSDYRTMLDTVRPDVAYVLCENSRKLETAGEIARRGIDIILEKPMAMNAKEATELVALGAEYHVNIFVNWPVVWRKYIRTMKNVADSGRFGRLLRLRYLNGHTGPLGIGARHRGVADTAEDMTDAERSRSWWYRRDAGGGACLDILCYGCYFARWMLGGLPQDVMSLCANLNTPCGDVEDNVAAILRYKNAYATLEGTWTTPRKRIPTGPEAVFSDGVIFCDGIPDGASCVRAMDLCGNEVDISAFAAETEEDRTLRNMPWCYAAFRLDNKPVHETLTAEFNADVLAMLDAVKKSAESRRAEPVLTVFREERNPI